MSQNLGKEILADKKFRHYWSEMYLRQNIPFQIKTMRTQRNLNQIEAGEILGKTQNGLSRLESPVYGRLTLQSLLDVAKGYDVGLIVKFVPFSRLLTEYDDVSFDALKVPSPDPVEFPEEVQAIEDWASDNDGIWEVDEVSPPAATITSFSMVSTDKQGVPDSQRYVETLRRRARDTFIGDPQRFYPLLELLDLHAAIKPNAAAGEEGTDGK